MQLGRKLNFEKHLSEVESKENKTIGIIRKLQNMPLQNQHFLQPISHSLGLFQIMEIQHMIKHLMSFFTLSWNHFSITPHWP